MNADAHLQGLGVTASNTNAANLAWSRSFNGNGILPTGASVANASATDAVPNTKTNSYALGVAAGTSSTLTFDANGNMTSDGTNSYSYDAENRLLQVTYPGTGNNSQFTYDALGKQVQILEYVSSVLSSTKIFVWCRDRRCEQRNATGGITAQFFSRGETISGTDYFYTTDHLGSSANVGVGFDRLAMVMPHGQGFNPEACGGSVREMANNSGTLEAQYAYDPWGQVTKLQGSLAADMQYAGYYEHAASGLNFTATRAYNSSLGRFVNRDPIGESMYIALRTAPPFSTNSKVSSGYALEALVGLGNAPILSGQARAARTNSPNVYTYVDNTPVRLADPSGMNNCICDWWNGLHPAAQAALVGSGGPWPWVMLICALLPDKPEGNRIVGPDQQQVDDAETQRAHDRGFDTYQERVNSGHGF